MQRGSSLAAVQRRLEAGESYGITKYSQHTTIDKTDWDEADHLVLLLYNLVEESTNNRNGPFMVRVGLNQSDNLVFGRSFCV